MEYGENGSGDSQGQVVILTLGQFAVHNEHTDLTSGTGRSYHLWDLFRFLITNRGKGIRPEVMVEALWPEQSYADPRRALRTPVYRLRKILDGVDTESPIIFSHGCYIWKTIPGYRLDVEVFEALCNKAKQISSENPSEAIKLYFDAIGLYKGEYLPECLYQDWVMPARNYYRRLYLQCVAGLLDLLWAREQYKEILAVCERAILLEPLEEEVHIRFLEALLKEQKLKQSLNHYEYITSLLYRQLGVKPSPNLRKLYKQIQDEYKEGGSEVSGGQKQTEQAGACLHAKESLRSMREAKALL